MSTSEASSERRIPAAWVLDLDGVVWLAEEPIAGAADAVALLRERGHEVVFVTNNSSVRIVDQEAKLASHGIPAVGSVISSAVVAAELVEPGETALVCAGPGVREALEARGVRCIREGSADVVVVGYHRDFDYERMTAASIAVRDGARLLATNADSTYPTPSGPIPGGGAILASIVTATGVAPIVAGKPERPAVDMLHQRFGLDGIMVGDRPDTDGGFAVALGYDFGLVLSGVTKAADLPTTPPADITAPDLLALVHTVLNES